MEVKGTAVLTIPIFVQKRFGKEGHKKWLDSLSPESHNIFKTDILASSWFPIQESLVEPTKSICDLFYDGKVGGAWDLGRGSADYGFNMIMKVFLKLGSVNYILKRASDILPRYYKPCSMEYIDDTENSSYLRITDFNEISVMVENRIGGWIERALELSGCQRVLVEIEQSLAKGNSFTEYRLEWH